MSSYQKRNIFKLIYVAPVVYRVPLISNMFFASLGTEYSYITFSRLCTSMRSSTSIDYLLTIYIYILCTFKIPKLRNIFPPHRVRVCFILFIFTFIFLIETDRWHFGLWSIRRDTHTDKEEIVDE